MIRLTLPLPPSLTNSTRKDGRPRSRHWRSLEREKKAYWTQLDMLVYARKIPRAPATPPDLSEIRATLHMHNRMDEDNAMARMKWPVDWLRKRGYIRGDSRRSLRWGGLPEQVIDRDEPRIELTIRPIPQEDAA